MSSRKKVIQERLRHAAFRPMSMSMSIGVGVALSVALISGGQARASTYRVYTGSAASSMTVNANDGACSLAEAVLHVNGKNNNVTYCTDFSPGGEKRIELLQSSGKPYSTNHFKIASLTLTTSVRVTIAGFGGAFIDATGTAASAFVIGVKGAAPSQSAVFFERVTLTNAAGAAGGRLLENYGTLQLYGVTITKGDVTGNQHPSGIGGGIYNAGAITSGEGCVITGNRARRGGGVYNDAGTIDDLFSTTISSNFASQAGGGIYNAFTGPTTYGKILSGGLTITQNKARTGGGIFNRGWIELTASSITSNATLSTGNSDESCTGMSCDGTGGGVVSVHGTKANMNTSAVVTRFNLMDGSEISGNTATLRGGAISSAGALQLTGFTMNSNTAPDGAAIYVVSPTDGSGEYCTIAGDDGVQDGPAAIIGNIANPGYSILSGGVVHDSFRCTFAGSPNYLVARGNSSPKLCNPIALNQVSTCPVQTP